MAAQATMKYHRSYCHRTRQMLYTWGTGDGQSGLSGTGTQRSVCQPNWHQWQKSEYATWAKSRITQDRAPDVTTTILARY